MKVVEKALLRTEPGACKRAMRERRLLSRLVAHPCIGGAEAFYEDVERLYLLLELMPGGDLHALLAKEAPLEVSACRFYAGCACAALDHLHNLEVIYRDPDPNPDLSPNPNPNPNPSPNPNPNANPNPIP